MYKVYILKCADQSLYVGCTNNVETTEWIEKRRSLHKTPSSSGTPIFGKFFDSKRSPPTGGPNQKLDTTKKIELDTACLRNIKWYERALHVTYLHIISDDRSRWRATMSSNKLGGVPCETREALYRFFAVLKPIDDEAWALVIGKMTKLGPEMSLRRLEQEG